MNVSIRVLVKVCYFGLMGKAIPRMIPCPIFPDLGSSILGLSNDVSKLTDSCVFLLLKVHFSNNELASHSFILAFFNQNNFESQKTTIRCFLDQMNKPKEPETLDVSFISKLFKEVGEKSKINHV